MTYCAAFGCNNTSKKGGVHLFSFPKDTPRRKTWTHYCRRSGFEPTANNKLCSAHFSPDQLERNPLWMAEYGYHNSRAKLKVDAIPDLPLEVRHLGNDENKPGHKRSSCRGAFAKRRRAEALQEVLIQADQQWAAGQSVFEDNSDVPVVQDFEDASSSEPTCMPTSTPVPVDPSLSAEKRYVSTKTQTTPHQRTRRIQVGPSQLRQPAPPTFRSVGIQCSLLEHAELKPCKSDVLPTDDSDSESDSSGDEDMNDDKADPDYSPMIDDETESEDDDGDSDEDGEGEVCRPKLPLRSYVEPEDERQYLVSESCLAGLLSVCLECGCDSATIVDCTRGTQIITRSTCVNGHVRQWQSQRCHNGLPWSNLLVSGAILYSGANAAQILRLMKHMKLQMFSQATYSRIQATYGIPSCVSAWENHQRDLITDINREGKAVTLGGDGRCDSPGYSAKFGSYTLMDLQNTKILDFQLVQSNEVQSSTHMELEGLKRGLQFLESRNVRVEELVTDRHGMVKKYMRTTHPDKYHSFDVWHVAKGVSKKLEACSKKKDCETIRPWIKSITNHCYYIAASCGRDGELRAQKWKTISKHVTNQHSASDGYIRCDHGAVDDREWIRSGSRAHKLVREVIEMKTLLNDIPKLSPLHQTYGLEVYHSVVNRFAPKNTHFFYPALTARICVAALHFNENGKRCQAVTKEGVERWQVTYPKGKKGETAVVKPVRTPVTFDYVEVLRYRLVQRRRQLVTYKKAAQDAELFLRAKPPPLTDSFHHIPKESLVEKRRTRFVV